MNPVSRSKVAQFIRKKGQVWVRKDLVYSIGEYEPQQRASHALWQVREHVRIDDGRIYNSGGERYYQPGTYPQIPFELAKLKRDDLTALRRFVEQWGRLGYTRLVKGARGEPMEWVWAHAATVRAIVDSIQVLGDFHDLGERRYASDDKRLSALSAHLCQPIAVLDQVEPCPVQSVIEERDAAHLVRMVLERNLSRVKVHLVYRKDGTFERTVGCETLLEHVYWHLSFVADGSMKIGVCAECGSYFRPARNGQLFCPAPPGLKSSPCGSRYSSRSWRQRNRSSPTVGVRL